MANSKPYYADFLSCVAQNDLDFVNGMHEMLTEAGCKLEIKEASLNYLVTYKLDKLTVMNYVFRKKGLVTRIYANRVALYPEIFGSFPASMLECMRSAPDCRRLKNPAACNPKCPMGYDYALGAERLQKCRTSAFMFTVTDETKPHILELVSRELNSRKSA